MQRKPEMETKRDGRVILRGKLYERMRWTLHEFAGGRCEILNESGQKCGRYTPLAIGHVHHGQGRGLGGGKRDDRIFVEGQQVNFWACPECHGKKHVPEKVVPKKLSDAELKQILGVN